jgi:hypothetical protein
VEVAVEDSGVKAVSAEEALVVVDPARAVLDSRAEAGRAWTDSLDRMDLVRVGQDEARDLRAMADKVDRNREAGPEKDDADVEVFKAVNDPC